MPLAQNKTPRKMPLGQNKTPRKMPLAQNKTPRQMPLARNKTPRKILETLCICTPIGKKCCLEQQGNMMLTQ